MKRIVLVNIGETFVDDEDFELLSSFKWFMSTDGYASRYAKSKEGKRFNLGMHRFLLGLSYGDKLFVDHKDGDRLNNQKSNLRACTRAENCRNRKPLSKNNTSGFKGVFWNKGKWEASIRFNGKTIYLKRWESREEAYEAYVRAAKDLHGEFSNT